MSQLVAVVDNSLSLKNTSDFLREHDFIVDGFTNIGHALNGINIKKYGMIFMALYINPSLKNSGIQEDQLPPNILDGDYCQRAIYLIHGIRGIGSPNRETPIMVNDNFPALIGGTWRNFHYPDIEHKLHDAGATVYWAMVPAEQRLKDIRQHIK